MPFASGTYTLPAGNPVVTATTITSTWANTTMSDIATALSTAVLKDGSQTMTANIPMAGFKFTGMGAGSATGNSLRYDDVFVTALGNIPMAGLYKMTSLAAGTTAGDSVRYEQAMLFAVGGTMGALIDMGGFKITDMANGTAVTDAAAFGQTKIVPLTAPATGYTMVLADAGKTIAHLISVDTTARTYTIDSNSNVAYLTGTTITFVNQTAILSLAITSDTMYLAGTTTTGTRSLAAGGVATAIKVQPTVWYISGSGIS